MAAFPQSNMFYRICIVSISVLCALILQPSGGSFNVPYHVLDDGSPWWDYSGQRGPAFWKKFFPECGGTRQSPIDILNGDASYRRELTPIDVSWYKIQPGPDKRFLLKNTGHSVQLSFPDVFYIEGGDLPAAFRTDQLHFHWASADTEGSEHRIDGTIYPMEIHIVHSSTKYDSYEMASNHTDGIAVLSFLFEISEEDNPHLSFILDHVTNITYEGFNMTVEPFPLIKLLPGDLSTYYRYQGSLTTPPCSQTVLWTVFKDTMKISRSQLKTFRSMKGNKEGDPPKFLKDNIRPLQPLNGRTVYTSVQSFANTLLIGIIPMASCLLVHLL